MENIIKNAVISSQNTINSLLNNSLVELIKKASQLMIDVVKSGGKIIIFGNGGSAADSQHMACELVGKFKRERRAIPAISLTANTSNLTAISNDFSYEISFKRQLEAIARDGDIAIAISTSGNSKNVIEAIKCAKRLGLDTIALTGMTGGTLVKEADLSIIVNSDDTPRIQEAHILIIHIMCQLIEDAIDSN